MIADLLRQWGSAQRREFDHDRSFTTGSSAIGQCARRTVFDKLATPPDPEFTLSWGSALRGTVIEDHYFYPALLAAYGDRLLFAGPNQQTFVMGFLSATPDGLVIRVPRDCLAFLGIADINGDCILTECKSIHPGTNTKNLPRQENEFQVQVAMGLVRRCTPYKPAYAVISYIDAADFSRVTEFAVEYDDGIFENARERARNIMTCENPLDMPPEGKLTGGRECEYCAWVGQCQDASIQRIPEGGVRLPADAVAELKGLRDIERGLAGEIENNRTAHAYAQEAIKYLLRSYDARAHRDQGWSVQWSTTKGRVSVDTAALEAAGIDLEQFKKEGKPGERLTVT